MTKQELLVDGRHVPIAGETNLLEIIRKAGIDLPTFCYHSELSVYGACRLCIVDVAGRGIQASCSLRPEAGMEIRTQTPELQATRRMTIELLLASHHQGCTTCRKSPACKLLDLANRLGVETVRFKQTRQPLPLDTSSPALVRDPNKCILCGDCVRMCSEIQGVGALGFAHRGAAATVEPAFGKDLADVECVHCGQCAAVCPTGAILPAPQTAQVWEALGDTERTVVAQLAPAVRVAVGEAFGLPPGDGATGKIVAALRALGFDRVYDTAFAADLTVLEEANEFLARLAGAAPLPLITSCCPAWVTYAERFYPDLLPHLSTCRSPQQMFGALAKATLPAELGRPAGQLTVVAIMPCTAKKFERGRPEFSRDGQPDVDHVLTTQELIAMIRAAGLRFHELEEAPFDQPYGFKTGAGVLFGNAGGVSEAVLRYAGGLLNGTPPDEDTVRAVRDGESRRTAEVQLGEHRVRMLSVSGLKEACRALEELRDAKERPWDFIEVMACPGGCVGGAGQPVPTASDTRGNRTRGIYREDTRAQLQAPQENPYVEACYRTLLGEIGGEKAHHLLHTRYTNRRRVEGPGISLLESTAPDVVIRVCLGTSCFLRGAQKLLQELMRTLRSEALEERVSVRATFCHERCNRGPMVEIDGDLLPAATVAGIMERVRARCTAAPA